jgi:uncharacterized membrane protein
MMFDPFLLPRGEELDDATFAKGQTRREHTGPLDSFALFTTNAVGTTGFFLVVLAWTFGWLAWNSLMPNSVRFDPYPAFVLWLFISNMIQLFLMPLIMIGQNIQSRAADKRAEADRAINRNAEIGVKELHDRLERIEELLMRSSVTRDG